MATTLKKPAADAVYVAVTSFITATGNGDVLVRVGERLRGDHAAVQRCPQLFAFDGSSDIEIHQQRVAAVDSKVIEESEKADRLERDERAKHEPPEIPVERRLRVRQGFRTGNFGRSFAEGQLVDRKDEAIAKIVAEAPQYFEVPGRPLT
jgi:hypothetical protein